MNILLSNYEEAKQALYDHVGFTEDWVVYPISDETEYYWDLLEDTCYFGAEEDVINLTGEHYEAEIYTQRFYDKHVFIGKDLTMVFGNPGVDGMKWFYVFDNKKRVSIKGKTSYYQNERVKL